MLAITEVVGVKICCGGCPRLSFYYDERVNLLNLAVGLGAALCYYCRAASQAQFADATWNEAGGVNLSASTDDDSATAQIHVLWRF